MDIKNVKALELDEGLDFLIEFEEFGQKHDPLNLTDCMLYLQEEGLLPTQHNDVEYVYDLGFLVLAELLELYEREGKISYVDEDENGEDIEKSFSNLQYTQANVAYLKQNLEEIVRPSAEVHDIYELWEEAGTLDEWIYHVEELLVFLDSL